MSKRSIRHSLVLGKNRGKFNGVTLKLFAVILLIALRESSVLESHKSPCPDFSKEKLAEHRFNVSVHRSSAVLERLSLGSTAISLYAHEGETFALYCTSLLTNQSYRYAEQLRFVLDFKPVQANASYLLHPTCSFEEIKIGVQLLFENVKPEDEGTITISVYNKNTAALFWNTTVIFHVLATPLKETLRTVSLGNEFTLHCPIQTELTVWEHKRGKKFKDVTPKSTSNRVLTRIATLAHAGFYRCSVRLPDGKLFVLLEIEIAVTGPVFGELLSGIATSNPATPEAFITTATSFTATSNLTVTSNPNYGSSLGLKDIIGLCVGTNSPNYNREDRRK
ncbi:uncharacterized protein [Oscarella lobularis]|uniref:uncharacterized protein isoform X2 n=1 Tax=Oscarella lobularis TaxID=121494 RepID=UPI0033133D31